ncbi:unnamed protein product [Adineta steineri]|uniref:Uncharacterized protein n=1 Tax=Adineta steineri TaxID=433720 RepID=A0A814YXR9_9BILA|nr:unnamed protein product [Adineta steineri]CAF3658284.1 unnamed protein product [Adineta steineri]
MYLSSILMLLLGMFMLLSTFAMPFPYVYQTDDEQANNHMNKQIDMKRSTNSNPWLNRRNSPLCDYRLQFRPVPLTSTLCGFGNIYKEEYVNQVNPFKYG